MFGWCGHYRAYHCIDLKPRHFVAYRWSRLDPFHRIQALLVYRKKPIFNPAALGLLLSVLLFRAAWLFTRTYQ
ncbi:hypothetical protein O9H85_18735 [Paenibacillus filicis]|uniref:Uncharacterized protein n=1 Tax=Paenibacillus gyeongsangnamensis TaxID=3388067 RepID=A0ABT4QC08_9BACL|nr:hypothetical protein [Paenibacillus filicis]MCZ8514422.1 hypothetical protein [Paenibacillus filicis]